MTDKIKVFIVDDSLLIRMMLKDVIKMHPQLEVIGIATNGRMAIRQLIKEDVKPDVITLDVEMPFMNGLETLQALKQNEKTKDIPVVMFSSLTAKGTEVTLKALDAGAFDFMQKPESEGVDSIKDEIHEKLLAAFKSKAVLSAQPSVVTVPQYTARRSVDSNLKTVVIASSTGGPKSLNSVIPYIPRDLPARILVVQHMPPKFTATLAERLNKVSQLSVKEAQEGDKIQLNEILLAQGNYHMCATESDHISLIQTPTVCGVRPAADVTLESCVKVYGENVISVVLTGMGHDGTEGTKLVKKAGGYCVAQDEATSVIYGMPKSVVDAGLADEVLPLHNIADAIVRLVSE